MGRFVSRLGLAAVIAGVAALVYAQRRSSETGKDIFEVLANLPEELRVSAAEWRQRLETAVQEGKKAADAREEEIEQRLASKQGEMLPFPDYVV